MQLEMELRLEIERQVRSALAGPAALIVFDPPGSMYPDVKPALGAAESFFLRSRSRATTPMPICVWSALRRVRF